MSGVEEYRNCRQMGLPTLVHVQPNLLYDIGDVGPSERQVL
jgi:hypothetical protein